VVVVLEKGFDALQSFGRLSPWSKGHWYLNIDLRKARQHSSRGGAGKKVTMQNLLTVLLCTEMLTPIYISMPARLSIDSD
jgi:hypothetical protein